ncbi:MAG: magnesium protoporphyrin IX methyltransferase [Pseudomonadota bacterium]
MLSATYSKRRAELETYFDKTAADAWAKLTSTAPVSGIRATVRAGRDAMRATMLDWIPTDLSGARVLDAGCGAGQFSRELAQRGAEVVAVDLSGVMVNLARERMQSDPCAERIRFVVGDMFAPALGDFDYVVAMDSLIHYKRNDIVDVLEGFAKRTRKSVIFTIAPKTPLLAAMHALGGLFPRADKAPAIEPLAPAKLKTALSTAPELRDFSVAKSQRISSGFYISEAMELARQ